MKVDVHGPGEPDVVLATVSWAGDRTNVETEDDSLRSSLQRAFRRTPVVIDDRSYRRPGTSGEVVIQPAGLEWFRAVVQARLPVETGLVGRLVPGIIQGGFDPAADYRSFEAQIERLTT